MKLSRFFDDLSSSYAYEIEDLTYDSGGDDVLKSRLKVKRDQFAGLLPMCESDPVMVAPAFHGGFHFADKEALEGLVAGNPDDFPTWESVAATLEMEPWAAALAQRALQSPGGEQFMLIAAGLEYILSRLGASAAAGGAEPLAEEDQDDGDDTDLGEAGEDFLGEQGFDRRS